MASLAADTPHDVDWLMEQTGGNPFFVTELVDSGDKDVPTSISDSVLAKVARLDEGARELVELIAVIPGGADQVVLDKLLAPTIEALDQCLLYNLLKVDGVVSFRHELARRAVEESQTTSRLQGPSGRGGLSEN